MIIFYPNTNIRLSMTKEKTKFILPEHNMIVRKWRVNWKRRLK